MEIDRLGDGLLEACGAAEEQLVLCAPFIKSHVLQRLLDATAEQVAIEVFTRWRPEEVAARVSDTAILSLAEARGGRVLLCDRLHAKYVRFDQRALVGSANLTGAALGWSSAPNLELLAEVPVTSAQVVELEARLRSESIAATQALADEVERIAALMPNVVAPEEEAAADEGATVIWYPRLREPRDLFTAYSGGLDRLSRASQTAGVIDLVALQLPPGLDREQFEALVASRLLQSPAVQAVDSALADSQRFGAVRDLLADRLLLSREDASFVWQTLMRWLLEFTPERYERSVPRWSEVLVRREENEISP